MVTHPEVDSRQVELPASAVDNRQVVDSRQAADSRPAVDSEVELQLVELPRPLFRSTCKLNLKIILPFS